MKKLIASVALALVFTVPFMDSAMADRKFMVAKSGTNIWDHSFERGNVRCTVQIGDQVYRGWGLNWPLWIYVEVQPKPLTGGCHGWVDKRNLERLAGNNSGIVDQEKRLKRLNETAYGF